MLIPSPFPDVDVPGQSVHDYLFGSLVGEDLSRVALTDGTDGTDLTYGELLSQVDLVAGALSQLGLGVGDVVALHAPNSPTFAVVLHGILRAGGTATTVNALYTADDVTKQLQDAGARFLMTVSSLLPQAEAAAARSGIPGERIIVLDGSDHYDTFDDLLSRNAEAPVVDIDPASHIAVLPYSSGTTGQPKGVMLTHGNLVANVAQTEASIGIEPSDVVLAVLPFFHIYGLTVLLNVALKRRARLVTMPRFDLGGVLELTERHGLTYLFVAPPVVLALAKSPLVDSYDVSSIHTVFSGAAPLDGELAQTVARRLDVRVLQGYGMSELSPVSHLIPIGRDDVARSSVGFPVPNTVNKLVDPATGNHLGIPREGVSGQGELWVRGPNVMRGYLGNPEATTAMIDSDGFLHTGDLAVVDSLGAVYIVDRLKELIKYKGYQVPPAELEALLLTHPAIHDAAVVGVPDRDGDEVPKAFVVVHEGQELDEDTVIRFVAAHVAPHKKVRAVEFIDAVPKSATGKILRRQLRQRAQTTADCLT